MIRVAHVITGLAADGAERMLQHLVTRMDRQQFQNEVISLTTLGDLGAELQAAEIPVRALGLTMQAGGIRALPRLKQMLGESAPDIVQTWMYHADLLGGLMAQWAGRRRVFWGIHHASLDRRTNKWSTLVTAKACALLSRSVPMGVVCCSEAARTAHIEFGYESAKAEVVPNGFDTEVFRPDMEARRTLREQLGASDEEPVIGLAARFHAHKDHANFLGAAKLVLSRYPNALFALCGRDVNWQNTELLSLLRRFQLADRVRLLDAVPDPQRFFAGVDIVVSSSRTEAFPLAVGEGMACGVPCVVTDVGDSALLVGATGLAVRPEDRFALAAGINQLLSGSFAVREALGAAARLRIQEQFSLGTVVARYQDLYRRAMLN